MKNRAILLIATSLLAGFVCALTWFFHSREQRYMEKMVVEWIEDTHSTYSTLADRKELQGALKTLGSNAVPTLIAILDHSETAVHRAKMKGLENSRLPQSLRDNFSEEFRVTHNRLNRVVQAFKFLGNDALHAIPELERIVCEPNRSKTSSAAARALECFGIAAMPALVRCRTNAPVEYQSSIQASIYRVYRSELNSSKPEARTAATLELARSPEPPSEIIPALVELLESPQLEMRRRALDALSQHLPNFGPLAGAAYPAVEKQTTSDDPEIRRVAAELLAKYKLAPPGMKP
ncbi:MAG: HEAT repeat domain-containing protein [Verrucomicrobia bacterium]|nr:HEAT repeat domain-containing protein [Verrucomicrobiota bacterium]